MTYKQETIKPYNDKEAKGKQVEQMFDNIAPSYDLLNHTLSFGIDRRWRRTAIESLMPYAPKRVLDVATGTGDFALLAAQMLQPESLVGIDLSDGMLQVAREKLRPLGEALPITFANEDLDKGLGEMLRVLRPGGRLVIIELTAPARFPMKQGFWLYSHVLMPTVGRIISHDKKAYSYLPATMEAFPQGEVMAATLRRVGYRDVAFRRFTFGLSTLYTACK